MQQPHHLETHEGLVHACMHVHLVDLVWRPAHVIAGDVVPLAFEHFETRLAVLLRISLVRDWDGHGGVRTPCVAAILLGTPEMTNFVDGPRCPALQFRDGLDTSWVGNGGVAELVVGKLGGLLVTAGKCRVGRDLVRLAVDDK
eukprot:6119247-Pleurochrysis_carterae.AAC.1